MMILKAILQDISIRSRQSAVMLAGPVVETTVLHSDGHDETSEEHVVGGVELVDGHLACRHDPQHGQQHHRDHRGHGQGQGLRQPVDSHQQDAVGTSQSLANLRINREKQDGRQNKWRQEDHPGTPEYSNEILQRSF